MREIFGDVRLEPTQGDIGRPYFVARTALNALALLDTPLDERTDHSGEFIALVELEGIEPSTSSTPKRSGPIRQYPPVSVRICLQGSPTAAFFPGRPPLSALFLALGFSLATLAIATDQQVDHELHLAHPKGHSMVWPPPLPCPFTTCSRGAIALMFKRPNDRRLRSAMVSEIIRGAFARSRGDQNAPDRRA